MSFNFSSNVVLAKARAMYGKRLTSKDYYDLLNCKSVNEVASYLKNRTHYSNVLSSINEADVHRGQLELLLKQKLFNDFASLARYGVSSGNNFSEYIVSRIEIEQIMHSLMLLSAGKTGEYLYSMPMFFNKHTEIDLLELSKMQNYNDFLKILSSSKYAEILKPLQPEKLFDIDLTMVETELYTYLYERVFYQLAKNTNRKAKKELTDIFNATIDARNFIKISRLKKYYDAEPDYISKALLPFGTLTKKQINDMINASSIEDIFNIMKSTKVGKKFAKDNYLYIDECYIDVRYKMSRKNIRFSIYPVIVMLSYIFLMEIEISNIVNIIEGVRYNVPSNDIEKMLVFSKK